MWSQVQNQLEQALCTTFFPRLMADAEYQRFLWEAGIAATAGLNLATLTPAQRAALQNVAKMRVGLFMRTMESQMAVNQGSAQFAVLRNTYVYRAANAANARTLEGMWWFTEDIWNRCLSEGGSSDADRLAWLHSNLAVCYDWSKCDRIVRLFTGDGLPAVQATGQPKTRFASPGMISQPLPGINHRAILHGGLPGGLTQTVLIFIPQDIQDVMQFSTAAVGNPYLR